MGLSRGTRSRALAACLFIALAFTSLNAPAAVGAPTVAITSPTDAHVFGPSEEILVTGTADALQGVFGVRVQYWLLNKLARDVCVGQGQGCSPSDCEGCGTPTATWRDDPGQLLPGYYVIKAYAVDSTGAKSDPKSRGFITGLGMIPAPETPPTPQPPTTPTIPIPGINPPKPGTLPGAEGPIPVRGIARPGSDVTIFDKNLGPIATTVAQGNGRWTAAIRFPTGTYSLVAQATDSRGRVSPVSKLVTFRIDATRPKISLPDNGGEVEIFPPLEEIKIEGHVMDNRRVAYVVLEYWLLDDMVERDLATCPACGEQEAIWYSIPKDLLPGYYYVKIRAFDSVGNPSWVETTSFIAA